MLLLTFALSLLQRLGDVGSADDVPAFGVGDNAADAVNRSKSVPDAQFLTDREGKCGVP